VAILLPTAGFLSLQPSDCWPHEFNYRALQTGPDTTRRRPRQLPRLQAPERGGDPDISHRLEPPPVHVLCRLRISGKFPGAAACSRCEEPRLSRARRMTSPMRRRLNADASTTPTPLQKRQTMVIGRQPLSMVQAMPNADFSPRQSGHVCMIDFSLMAEWNSPKHFLPRPRRLHPSEMTRVGMGLHAAQPPTSETEQLKQPCQSGSGPSRTGAASLSGVAQGDGGGGQSAMKAAILTF
jgi:hypothetical protein